MTWLGDVLKLQSIHMKLLSPKPTTSYRERKLIWPELSSLSQCLAEAWCLGGDFNITRWAHERFPLGRSTRGMSLFNKFIVSVNLSEISLHNGRFTWSRESDSPSRSLLDKFLINKDWDDLFENSRVSRKARIFSYHFPIFFGGGCNIMGPYPFSLLQ